MKTQNTTPTTRASLLTTASCNNRWIASLLAGTAVLGSVASATNWVGDTSTDWNDPLNWSGDAGTAGSNAYIDISSPVATISANTLANPVDIFVGRGGGTNGRLDHTAGVAATGGGNWMFVGDNGGTGVFNLANTAGTGGTYTGMAQGTGTFNASRLYIGGYAGTGSNGTVNVNTTGTLAISSELNIGTNASVGVLNVDSGTITSNNWLRVGAGSGSTGRLRISGGSVTKGGNDHLIVGENAGSSGTITLDAGSLTVNNECWIGQAGGTGVVNINGGTLTNNSWVAIGRASATSHGTVNQTGGTWNKTGGGRFIIGDGSVGTYNLSGTGALAVNGELWVGQGGNGTGTIVMSGGSITSDSVVAVGRDGGTASVTMSGGTWTKTGNGAAYIIGASGPATFNHSAGLIDVQAGDTWLGESNLCNYTLSGTGEIKATYLQVARNGSATGKVNLNGGTLRANQIVGGSGTENVSFNGTQIIARVDQTNFIGGMDAGGATIDAGGLLVNSNGFTVTAPQSFDGSGGVVKTGAGSLALTGGNSYTGNNVLSAGTLTLSAAGTGTGSITTADGTTLGLIASSAGDQLTASTVTLGVAGATTLNLNFGDVAGTNPTQSILDVTGSLTLNGVITVNVAGARFAEGEIPLISYSGQKSGSGTFVLGTVPNGMMVTLNDDGSGLVSMNYETDHSDADMDGLTAYDEVIFFGTDPFIADTDGDGLSDGYELGVGRFSIITGFFTWQQARTDARSKGGDLASFPTEDRWNRALQNLAANPFEDFIGLWIGASDAGVDGTWTWVNGESFSFAPWGTSRPSFTAGNTLDFTEVSGGGGAEIGKWYDRSSTTIRDGYLLETGYATSPTVADTDGDGLSDGQEVNLTGTNPLLTDTNGDGIQDSDTDQDADGITAYEELVVYGTDPTLLDTDGDGLGDGYELGIGRFSIVTGSFTWQQARTDARSKGGELACFPTEDRWNRALQGLGANPFDEFTGLWIGASDAAVDGTWIWVNGEAFSFAPWGTGRPSSTAGNTLDFAEVSGGGGAEIGQWYDRSPTTVREGYILESGYATSPLLADTDGDGVNDGVEEPHGPATTPPAPIALVVTPGNGRVSIAFTAGADGGALITNYQFSVDNGTNWTAFSPAITVSPVIITGLANGTTYNLRLRAVNTVGAGTASNTVTGTPIADAEPPIVLSGSSKPATTTSISASKLASRASSVFGTAATVAAADAASEEGGTVVLAGSVIQYTPAGGFVGVDRFRVTFSTSGGELVGLVEMTTTGAGSEPSPSSSLGVNPGRLTPLSNGKMGIQFNGIPGVAYQLQRSTDLVSWTTVATITAGSRGEISYTDENPPSPNGFYRLSTH